METQKSIKIHDLPPPLRKGVRTRVGGFTTPREHVYLSGKKNPRVSHGMHKTKIKTWFIFTTVVAVFSWRSLIHIWSLATHSPFGFTAELRWYQSTLLLDVPGDVMLAFFPSITAILYSTEWAICSAGGPAPELTSHALCACVRPWVFCAVTFILKEFLPTS